MKKGIRTFPVICLLFFSFQSMAQKNKCKFLRSTNKQTGKVLEMVAAPTVIGNFYLAKDKDSIIISYSKKLGLQIIGASPANPVMLDVQNVEVAFDDQSKETFTAIGFGTVENTVALKPKFATVQFRLVLSKNDMELMLNKVPIAFKVNGEKEAEYHDAIKEKQKVKYKEACKCILEKE